MTGGTPAPREGGAAFTGQVAGEVTAGEPGAAAASGREVASPRHEVTFTQQGMWVTEQAVKVGTAYHMPLLVHLRGALDAGALLAACAAVVDRHPMLRGVVAEVDDELRLVPGAEIPVRRATGSPGGSPSGPPTGSPSGPPTGSPDGFPAGSPDGEGTAGVDAAVREEILREFDLEHGPLARFTLFETGPGRHLLVFVAHHLIFDGQSKDILVRDLAAFYNGERPSPLPEIDHGRSERDRVAAMLPAAKEFWAPRWRDPGETVLLGRALRSRRAGEGRVLRLTADPSVPGLTRFEVLLAALHVLLSGYGNAEVTTAVDLSTRPAEAADHIGLFVNELPVASTPSPEATFREFATGLRAELRQVYRFRQVPLTRAMPRIRPHAALVPVSVSYRTRHEVDPVFTGLDASVEWTVFNHAVRGALHLQCVDGPGGLTVSLRHDPEAVPDAPRVADDLRLLLERATHDPDLPLKEILNQILE
ncbi:condensation domain-containing protein [Streptosporangium roseum]|uniref:condensation domain-containing protein n=1 Tax=Streptosporangium roseum TaxID=2001 RepID=UPI0004CDBC3C|nr:condensation domain-containing protein [Streptosporangium roseum]